MPAGEALRFVTFFYRHMQRYVQNVGELQGLDDWLLSALRSIRPAELYKAPAPSDNLPALSVILGTLIEDKGTREFAGCLIMRALSGSHRAQREVYAALDILHGRYPAFPDPFRLQFPEKGETIRFFDEGAAAETFGFQRPSTVAAALMTLTGRTSPLATHFDPPTEGLSAREEVFGRLREGLVAILDAGGFDLPRPTQIRPKYDPPAQKRVGNTAHTYPYRPKPTQIRPIFDPNTAHTAPKGV